MPAQNRRAGMNTDQRAAAFQAVKFKSLTQVWQTQLAALVVKYQGIGG
jgi:hypothetical protein